MHLIAHAFPIVMCVSGTLVGLFGWIRDKPELETWALIAFVISAAFVAPAYLTGLAAADVVADRTFVRPGIVQTHRFAATWAAIPVFTAGALAAFSLHERDDRKLRHFVFVVGLLAAVVVSYAAWLGSKIEHGDAANSAAGWETPDTRMGDGDARALPGGLVVLPDRVRSDRAIEPDERAVSPGRGRPSG
jgi:uncharacterized membrane protein